MTLEQYLLVDVSEEMNGADLVVKNSGYGGNSPSSGVVQRFASRRRHLESCASRMDCVKQVLLNFIRLHLAATSENTIALGALTEAAEVVR